MVVSFCSLINFSFVAVKQHGSILCISSHGGKNLESEASTLSVPLSSKGITDSIDEMGTDLDTSPITAATSQSDSKAGSAESVDNKDHCDQISDSGKNGPR